MWAKWWQCSIRGYCLHSAQTWLRWNSTFIGVFKLKIARQTRVEAHRVVGNYGREIPLVAEQVARAVNCTLSMLMYPQFERPILEFERKQNDSRKEKKNRACSWLSRSWIVLSLKWIGAMETMTFHFDRPVQSSWERPVFYLEKETKFITEKSDQFSEQINRNEKKFVVFLDENSGTTVLWCNLCAICGERTRRKSLNIRWTATFWWPLRQSIQFFVVVVVRCLHRFSGIDKFSSVERNRYLVKILIAHCSRIDFMGSHSSPHQMGFNLFIV